MQFGSVRGRRSAIRAATWAARVGRYTPMALTGVASIMLISSLINPGLWTGARQSTSDKMAPVLAAVGEPFQILSDAIGEMTGLTQIRAENAQLKAENIQLKEWYQTALLLQAENQSLRDLLNVIPEPDQSYITSRVIGDSGSGFVKTILIEAGTQQGVEEGQAVLGSQGMIGRVIEPGERAARVLLLSDINSHVPVVVEGMNQRAILAGTNSDHLILTHLPEDILVQKGARIVTSGTGGMFPTGLPVGEVVDIVKGIPIVRLFSDPYTGGYVQVVEKPQDQSVRDSITILTGETK